MNQAEVRTFFDGWALYEAILDCEAMHHTAFFAAAAVALARDFGGRPVAVVDLGCGSARHAARLLAGKPVAAYTGYDLAEAALRGDIKDGDAVSVVRNGDKLEFKQRERSAPADTGVAT